MDLMMPEMDGYETAKFIRKKLELPKSTIPIIALTADVTKQVKIKCTDAGMNDYISKPFNPLTFYKKIVKWSGHISNSEISDIEEKMSVKSNSDKLIDLVIIRDHAGGDIKYIREMIQLFIELMPEYYNELNDLFINKEWEELGKQAHKMKTPVAYFGVDELRELLVKIEMDAVSETISVVALQDNMRKIEALISASINELKQELNKIS